jgi:hypothetical protein
VLAVLLAIGLAATALAACGDEESQDLSYTLTSEGKTSSISGPDSAEAGLAEVTLVNEGEGEGELQLIRVEGDHSAQEVIEALGGVVEGKPFPEWFFAAGGVAAIPAGETATITQVLEPGTYFAADLESDAPPKPANLQMLAVSGEDPAEDLPEADAEVSAFEYGFETEGLSAGTNEVVFDNVGAQPHHLIASPLVGDATAEEVERFFKTEQGKPPLEEKGTQQTTVLEGGEGQTVTLDLEPGRYVLYCFISDRQGGPPHVIKGMVDEVEVQ